MGRIKEWEELTICDNFLFQKVMQNPRLCKRLIEKLLCIKVKNITYPDAEKTLEISPTQKGIRLDLYVETDTGVLLDIDYSEFRVIPSFSSQGILTLPWDEKNRNNFSAIA